MDEMVFIEHVKAGATEQVAAMLAEHPALASAQTEAGLSALLLATYYGHTAIAQLIVQRRDALNVFEAAALGDAAQARTILTAQPELIDAANVDGFSPLGLAAFFGHADVANLLLGLGANVNLASRNTNKVMPLHSAVAGQHEEIVRALVEQGADVNARQEGGFTPLHGAAQNGQLSVVELLLQHGANPHAANDEGKTALEFARESGNEDVMRLLSVN